MRDKVLNYSRNSSRYQLMSNLQMLLTNATDNAIYTGKPVFLRSLLAP